MEQVTDKMRVDALGGGMAQQAAMAKMLRQRQLDAIIEQASAGQAPMQQASAPQMQGPAMSQAEFSGYGAGGSAQQTPQQQLQLQELLRRRQQMPLR